MYAPPAVIDRRHSPLSSHTGSGSPCALVKVQLEEELAHALKKIMGGKHALSDGAAGGELIDRQVNGTDSIGGSGGFVRPIERGWDKAARVAMTSLFMSSPPASGQV